MKLFVALGVVSLLASVADGGVSMHNPFYCYSTDPIRSMTQRMSSLNSYEHVRHFNFTIVHPHTPTGAPSRFWYLGRETSRYFTTQESLQQMIDFAQSSVRDNIVCNYDAGRTTLCRPDFESIRDFSMDVGFARDMTPEKAGTVMESGVIIMENIARRFQEMFPNILTQNYSPDRFLFRHASPERSNVSIRAFASGLFGDAQNIIYEDVPTFDWFLAPRDSCPAFSEETAEWAASRYAFGDGPEIEELIEQINRRLGFSASNQLSFDQILNMWYWCRHEMAFETSNSETLSNSTWCAPFSPAHHHILEYWIELGYVYLSYGVRNQRLLENLNCGLMQDLITHMQSNNSADQVARIFMTEISDFQTMLVLFGAFRDVWLQHQHNFAQQADRRWRTGVISPFSANIVVVRYDSDDGDHDLVFLLNEKPMLVPGCDQQSGVCKLSVFVNRFQRFINANCAEYFCTNN